MAALRKQVAGCAIVCLAVLTCLAATARAADVVAELDRTEVVEGETVTLILQTSDPKQSLDAELEALDRDFVVLDQRTESRMTIVNGRQEAIVRRLLVLEPRRSGRLRIPPLTLPGARTEPLYVDVREAPEPAPGEMPPVFIELSLDPPEGPYYVHAQLSLTVKIFYQQNLTEARINPPAPEQASVRLLDEVPFPAERNGTRYRVLQRRYAIFPERSGSLVIPPMSLSGRLIERPSDRLWQPSVRGRRVTEETEPLQIEIQPKPPEFEGAHWLPARELALSQQVSEKKGLRVGEPVTRTVIVDAVGLEENMLEEPPWPELDGVRIYPDQPQGISRDDGQWVRGHKEFRYAVVPEEPGELILPELRMDWWDTRTHRVRTATLPEVKIDVAPADLAPDTAPAQWASGPEEGAGAGSGPVQGPAVTPAPFGGAWPLLTLLFALLWLVTLVLLLRQKRRFPTGRDEPSEMAQSEAQLLGRLKRACHESDAGKARFVLRNWIAGHGPASARGSVVQLAAEVKDETLHKALRELNAAGFSGAEPVEWDGPGFWRAFSAWHGRRARKTPGSDATDPDLYAPAR